MAVYDENMSVYKLVRKGNFKCILKSDFRNSPNQGNLVSWRMEKVPEKNFKFFDHSRKKIIKFILKK